MLVIQDLSVYSRLSALLATADKYLEKKELPGSAEVADLFLSAMCHVMLVGT